MPFLGKDWRSSGDEWIRTELGWERTKVLECILDNLNTGLRHAKTSSTSSSSNSQTLNKSRMSILNEKDQDTIDQDIIRLILAENPSLIFDE